MDFGLTGKHILVTGASDGFGKALATVLASERADLTVHDLEAKRDKLEALCADLRSKYGVNARALGADLSDAQQAEALFSRAERARPVDMLVNNAAIWPTAYVRDMRTDSYKRTLDINLIAPFILCRQLANALISRNAKGKIVNMVSQAAFHGSTSGHAHYAASKAGMVAFSISLAREVAPMGINVNCVAPGMMRTPMNQAALEAREAEYLERIPLGRIADPEEVAYAVAFLLSDKSDYITGATLDLTGGMLMR